MAGITGHLMVCLMLGFWRDTSYLNHTLVGIWSLTLGLVSDPDSLEHD